MTPTIMQSPVDLSVSSGVATITLNRPERLNALSREMLLQLQDFITQVAKDDAAKVVLICAAGRAFCVGQDLSERDPRKFEEPFDLEALQHELYHPVVRNLAELEKPVVVAINGLAAGAGVGIALAGDVIIASDTTRLLFSFAKVGLSVDAGVGWHLVRALGDAKAKALMMLGGELSAQEAERCGLISNIVSEDNLSDIAHATATQLAQGPATALRSIKKAVAKVSQVRSFAEYLTCEAELQGDTGRSPDYREGVLAFLEKRQPKFGV